MEKKLIPELRFPEFSGEWEKIQVGETSQNVTKGTTPKKYINKKEIKFIRIENILNNSVDSSNIRYISNKEHNYNLKRSILMENDILFSIAGVLGLSVKITKNILPANTNQAFSIIRLTENNTDFILKQLNTIRIKKYINSMATVGAQPNLSLKQVSSIILYLPSLPEQEKIGDFFFKLDKRIELQRNYVEKLKDKKKGLMQRIFSKEIRFKDENGEVYPEWNEKKFGEISTVNQGLQIPISNRFTEPAPNRYFYLTNEFLKEGSKEKYYIENPPESVICTESDVLMTRTGNTGMVVTDVDGAFHNNFFIINYDKDIITKEFLVLSLKSYYIQKDILIRAGGSTILDINHSEFYKVIIMIPSLPEQDKIANILSTVDEKIELEVNLLEKYEDMKKGLMQRMFI